MGVHYERVHRKVFLWWTSWWAVQLVLLWEFSFGIRIEPRRPLIDVFVGPFTIALGKHPVLTDPRMMHRHSGRGFTYANITPRVDELNESAIL